jgi:hypothetical protein
MAPCICALFYSDMSGSSKSSTSDRKRCVGFTLIAEGARYSQNRIAIESFLRAVLADIILFSS